MFELYEAKHAPSTPPIDRVDCGLIFLIGVLLGAAILLLLML